MTISIESFDDLTEAEVIAQQEILAQFLQDKYPNIDIKHGVFHDLVQYVNGIFSARLIKELDRWRASNSLLAIKEDSTLADDDTVDRVLSNFNVTRKSGSYTTGNITLEFSQDMSVIIPSTTMFTSGNYTYALSKSYLIYNSTSTSTAVADRVLVRLTNGNYGCSIPVTATEVGSDSALNKGDSLKESLTILNLVNVYASDNFSAGSDEETNAELIARLESGIATPCWGGRSNIISYLRNSDLVPSLIDASVIGYGDAEMQRDVSPLFPVSIGGKVDVYVKPVAGVSTATVQLTATAVSVDCNGSTWSCAVPNSALPGFWRITSVTQSADYSGTSFSILDQKFTSSDNRYTDSDAYYSAFQQCILSFYVDKDTKSNVSINDTDKFNITVTGVPYISDITSAVNATDYKPIASDVLVKAAVPCFINVDVVLLSDLTDTQKSLIKSKITSDINNTGFCSTITASDVSNSIYSVSQTSSVKSINLSGTILIPGGSVWRQSSSAFITIPTMYDFGVSPNTTVFYTGVSAINIRTQSNE